MLRANLPSSSGTVCRTARKLRLPFFLANLFSFLFATVMQDSGNVAG